MTVIAELTVPVGSIELGCIVEEFPDVEVELERIVPLRERTLPLLWIGGGDPETMEASLRSYPKCESVNRLMTTDDRSLFEVRWSDDLDGMIPSLIDHRATVLEARGSADDWDFRIRFPSHDDLSKFNMALTEHGISVTLRHLYNPTKPTDDSVLSPYQRETLLRAYDRGYFDVPRQTTLTELAAEQDVTDSALSQRIRRATARLIEQSLLSNRNSGG